MKFKRKRTSQKQIRRQRIKMRIRKWIFGTPERPRLVVSRSIRNISAQVVDDTTHRTLFGISSLSKDLREVVANAKSKVEVAKIVGKAIGEEAKKRNITKVVFDRNGYLYHGRVKALADGAREAGLEF